jgi:hypothetical protein
MKSISAPHLLGAVAALTVSAAAWAQTSPPTSTPPSDKPSVTKPEAAPAPPSPGAPHTGGRAIADSATHPLIGRNALSSDGNKVGDVRAVKTTPDGRITAIQLKVGGFLGFGGRIVEVTEDKFMQKGDVITIDYTLDEANKLPEAKDAS